MSKDRIHKGVIVNDGKFPRMLALAEPKPKPSHDPIPDLVTPDTTSGPAEWGRYHDAVREASRSFDNPGTGDIKHFLNARARHPEKVDVEKFHEAVRRQRMGDLVDIADHHMRRDGSLPRGSRQVRIQAPKGYLRRALRQSSPEDLAHLHHRLTSIGHDPEGVSKFLSGRVNPDMWDQAASTQIEMSDGEFSGLNFNSDDFATEWEDPLGDVVEAVAAAFQKMPQPIINVYVDSKKEEVKE